MHNVNDSLVMTLMVGTLVLSETNEIVPFKCKVCDFHASMRINVEKHYKISHEVLKYFDCSQCLFRASNDYSDEALRKLDEHVRLSH